MDTKVVFSDPAQTVRWKTGNSSRERFLQIAMTLAVDLRFQTQCLEDALVSNRGLEIRVKQLVDEFVKIEK